MKKNDSGKSEKNKEDRPLTRSKLQENPQLKDTLVIPESSIFSRSRKTPRSPTRQTENLNLTPKTTVSNQINSSDTNIRELQQEYVSNFTLGTFSPLKSTINIGKELNLDNTVNNTLAQDISLIDIEGILDQPSLIRNNLYQNQDEFSLNNLTTHLVTNTEKTMAENQPLKLSIKQVISYVPAFDGKNLPANEYIQKLKQIKSMVDVRDEPNVVQCLKINLRGEVAKALANARFNTIDNFITAVRKLYPSMENIHTLYGKLTEIIQNPSESVINYGNRLTDLVIQIKELKRAEAGITDANVRNFEELIDQDALISFKNGLNSNIRVELGENRNLDEMIQEAIAIEARLNKQNAIRNNSATVLCGIEMFNNKTYSNIYTCQICQDYNHEALFCNNAACVYCKNRNHLSNNCKAVKSKIELICRFCNAPGHSIDACKMNKSKGNHCQYCQVMGHTVSQCPFIIEYEVCWKCKESGHNPNICTNTKKQMESCEFCNNTTHSIQNCPLVICQRCNKMGHTLKYCPMLKNNSFKFIMCTLCEEQGHEAADCEEAKILVSQNKSYKNNQTQIKCQVCDEIGHSGKFCSKIKNHGGNNSNYNQNYKQNYCDYCQMRNHTVENCRKLKNIETQAKKKDGICSYCQEKGHTIDKCGIIKELESRLSKFCSICKATNHVTDECFRRQNNSGNE